LHAFFNDGLALVGSCDLEEVKVGFQSGGFFGRGEESEDSGTLAICVPLDVFDENVFAIMVDDD